MTRTNAQIDAWIKAHDAKHALLPLHPAAHSHPVDATLTARVKELERQMVVILAQPVVVPPKPPSLDPAWTQAWTIPLRAAFTGIVYDNTYTMPTGAGYTDGTDCYANVAAFIASKGDGASASHHTRIIFPAGFTYTFSGDNGLHASGRHNMTFDGTGCTLAQQTTGVSNHSAIFFNGQAASDHIVWRGFNVVGVSPNMATNTMWTDIRERDHGLHVRGGCSYIEMHNVTMTQIRGWPIYINLDDGGAWPANIWVHGCSLQGGETSIAPIAVDKLLIEDSSFNDAALMAIDFEPEVDGGGQGYRDVLMQRNDFGAYGWDAPFTKWFLAMNPAPTALGNATMDRLTLYNNTLHGGDKTTPGRGALTIRCDKENIKNDTYIIGNVSSADASLASIPTQFNAMVNLTLTGNTQIRTGHGTLYQHSADATDVPDVNVVSTPNTT